MKTPAVLHDGRWAEHAGRPQLQIALATFGILALELALIRWTSGQMRLFAYFSNLVLIGAFLGMGLGVALGRRFPGLMHGTLPVLAAISAVLAFSGPLGLMHMGFPDPSIHIWGAEATSSGLLDAAGRLAVFLGLFLGVVAVFVFAGAAVGHLFTRLGTLQAYSFDLAGSLAGVLLVSAVTASGAGPHAWLALGVLPFIWLSRRPLPVLAGVATVLLGWASVEGAVFSPYNRIDVEKTPLGQRLSVNRDFHQYMHNLSDAQLQNPLLTPEDHQDLRYLRMAYDLPFTINAERARALVVGAGTGNDVQAALRAGYRDVVSLDIDPQIVELGRRHHPEQPYSDPRASVEVNDARAFFEHHQGPPFDAVVYGLLDSHAMFSALSSLRLDNYVYTEEGLRSAWRHVGPRGHLSLSFSVFGGPWIANRMYWTLAEATGQPPIVFCHEVNHGCAFVVARDPLVLDISQVSFKRMLPSAPREQVLTTSDDWPFLYLRPSVVPWGYLIVLAFVLTVAAFGTRLAFGRGAFGQDFDPVLFLMGAAFLLIETRGVTSLSLLFGSTWLVNAVVFAGILAVVLVANILVARRGTLRLEPWFMALLAAVALLWVVAPAQLAGLPLLGRAVVGGLLTGLPVGIAGVVVSNLLARSSNPSAALGSNLLGSVVGGCLEYLSMAAGLSALAGLAAMVYLTAWLLFRRRMAAEGRHASPASR